MKSIVKNELSKIPYTPDKILIGVSGGSDSMALLHIVHSLNRNICVLHANHKLRSSSDNDENFVKEYCEKQQIPYISRSWENPAVSNIEEEARNFRYQFFYEEMQKYQKPLLLIAHHQDDQIETLIQKFINGNTRFFEGIPQNRPFSNGYLLRPLLKVDKKSILEYVQMNKIPYVEDESNSNLEFQRNKVRNYILPILEKENPNFKRGLLKRFSKQQRNQEYVIENGYNIFENIKLSNNQYELQTIQNDFLKQYSFVQYFIQYLIKNYKITFNYELEQQLLNLIGDCSGNKTLNLNNNYKLERNYTKLSLVSAKIVEKNEKGVYTLSIGESFYLSSDEFIYFGIQENPQIDKQIDSYLSFKMKISESVVKIRTFQEGDRYLMTENQTKKVNRLFIDEKIPKGLRNKIRIITDLNDNILGVLPLRRSYLSKSPKTDKIYYIIYYYRKR